MTDHHAHDAHHHADDGHAKAQTVKDPVCGMAVDPAMAQHRAEHAGKTYYFCSARCQAKFEADPGAFVASGPGETKPVPQGVIYTCPMHPQIRQVGPGNCPICGMTLEPEVATAETGPSAELIDMTRRFWIGLALALPVLSLEMGGHLTDLAHAARRAALELDPVRAGDARGAVGRLAVFPARLAIARARAISTCSR